MKTIKQLEKDISKIGEGCNKELGEDYQELSCGEDFDNEESKSGASFILCQNCREKLFRAESKLEQTDEIIELIEDEYPNIEKRECRIEFSNWKEKFLTKLRGEK